MPAGNVAEPRRQDNRDDSFGTKGTAANPLTRFDIQNVIRSVMTSKSWSANNGNNLFVVFTPNNVISCFDVAKHACIRGSAEGSDACGWHWNFVVSTKQVIYADMPDVAINPSCLTSVIAGAGKGPNGDPTADSEINILSHELFESITDPQPFNNPGWYYLAYSSGEIGDLCNFNFGAPSVEPDGSDLLLNPTIASPKALGDPYLVQMEYSNALHGCTFDPSGAPVSHGESAAFRRKHPVQFILHAVRGGGLGALSQGCRPAGGPDTEGEPGERLGRFLRG
jgi:hypothetical protein